MILDPGDCQAKGALERSHRFLHGNFEAGRRFANALDFQDQLTAGAGASTCACTARRAPWSQSAFKRSGLACERCRRPCPTPMSAS